MLAARITLPRFSVFGRAKGRAPTARPSGLLTPLLAAGAPAAAPEAAPSGTKISAASAPRPAVPTPATSASDRRHIGWCHWHRAHRSKRLRIRGSQRSPTPAAANKTVFLMDRHVSLSIAARRDKSVLVREMQSDSARRSLAGPCRTDQACRFSRSFRSARHRTVDR
jgi:hypothetical protein